MISIVVLTQLLISVGFTQSEAPVMVCIANLESSLRPNALNINKDGSKDWGLFQINDRFWLGECGVIQGDELWNIDTNVKCAKKVYDKMGFRAWVQYNRNKNLCENQGGKIGNQN